MALAADLVLITHGLFVLWVVGGLGLILAARFTGWRWAGNRVVRLAHLAAIAFVVVQTWRGRPCPLTTWENALRVAAGEDPYDPGGFVAHWLHRVLFYDAPLEVFAWVYSAFAALVLASFFITPVRWRDGG